MRKNKSALLLAFVVASGLSFSAFADHHETGAAHDANNTGKNARDYKTNTQTADRQAEGSRTDVSITREIRKEIMRIDALSSSAKNVKIVTKGGIVHLRGPVETAEESAKIQSIAQNRTGVTQVVNELEVMRRAE